MSDWHAIKQEYEQGELSLRALARKHGVSKTYLIERRDKEQWHRPTTDHRPTDRPPDTSLTPKKEGVHGEKQQAFLAAYAEHANVLLAARSAGISRQTVYSWLEHDEAFSLAYHQAKEDAKDTIRAEIYRRAVQGWDEPVYQLAKLAGKVRKYDTTLLIFHAKMLMPEYRDKSQVDVNATVSGQLGDELRWLSDEQLAQFKAWLLDAKARRENG